MTVKIGFSTNSTWYSKVIRWFTKSKVSHVFFLVDDPIFNTELVVEATTVGFRAIPLEKFMRTNEVVKIFMMKYDLLYGFRSVSKHLGNKYDYAGVLGMFIVLVRRWMGKKIRNPFQNPGAIFCSEAVAEALNVQEYPGWVLRPPETVDPDFLYNFCSEEAKKLSDPPGQF